MPYELTASFLLMADSPGVPRPIKLQEQHKPFVPLNQPLSENSRPAAGRVGARIVGGTTGQVQRQSASHGEPVSAADSGEQPSPDDISALTARLIAAS